MKFFLITSLLISSLTPFIVKAQENNTDPQLAKSIRIDPNSANGGAMSQVFSNISFIPLETKKESLFGDITQLEVTENHYIIFDRDTKSILIFDRLGKFHARIYGARLNDKVKSSDNSFYGFYLQKEDGRNIIKLKIRNKIYKYDTDANLIKVQAINPNEIRFEEEYVLDNKHKVATYFQDKGSGDTKSYTYALLEEGKLKYKYFEVDTSEYSQLGYFAVGGPSFIRTDNTSKLHIVRFYDYNIYQLTSAGMSIAFKLVFPNDNTIPADFNTNPLYLGKKMDYFLKNGNKIYGIGHTYQIGDYLYFKCGSLSPYIRNNGSFVYDLKNDYLISLNRLDIDSTSHNLPIIGRWENDFKKYDGEHLYASLSSLEMFTFYEQEKSKKIKYPTEVERYFQQGNKKDNPVIIQLKPKKSR